MGQPEILGVAALFGLHPQTVHRPENAKLTSVFVLDELYILRGRPYLADTVSQFKREVALLEAVRPLIDLQVPTYHLAADGHYYALAHDTLWTMHSRLPGRTLGDWFELHLVDPSTHQRVMLSLAAIHRATRGHIPEHLIQRAYLPALVHPHLALLQSLLPPQVRQEVEHSLDRVVAHSSSLLTRETCFVHGDFHHGNLLADNSRAPVATIDLNWCRGGSAYEDLGYTLMMLLRDYSRFSPKFRGDLFQRLLLAYGEPAIDPKILGDYLVLAAAFDCGVFSGGNFPEARRFLAYQVEFLAETVRSFS